MTSFFWSEAVEYQIDHREVDEVFSGLGEVLIVFAESAVTIEPGECPLDDPALGQHFEAFGRVTAADNFERPAGELFDPLLQFPAVAAVGPELLQARAIESDLLDQLARPVAILHAGRMHHHAQGQSQGIDDNVALTSFNLLASVVTATRPPFSVVLTDWLSMMAALGVASRPFHSRSRSWSLS